MWPRVEELRELRVVDSDVPPDHRAVFDALLVGYSGVCNFNYKVRADGRLCVFEVNVRSGEDLAADVPPDRLRCLLERLDGALPPLGAGAAPPHVAPPPAAPAAPRAAEAPF